MEDVSKTRKAGLHAPTVNRSPACDMLETDEKQPSDNTSCDTASRRQNLETTELLALLELKRLQITNQSLATQKKSKGFLWHHIRDYCKKRSVVIL